MIPVKCYAGKNTMDTADLWLPVIEAEEGLPTEEGVTGLWRGMERFCLDFGWLDFICQNPQKHALKDGEFYCL